MSTGGIAMKKFAQLIVEKRLCIFIIYILIIAASIFGIFQTNVNYDMSKYLPDNSSTKKGMGIMSDEFGDMSSITVMFHNLTEERQLEIKSELETIEHVKSVVYFQNDENYQKDNYSKYMITISSDTYSKETSKVLEEIKRRYKNEEIYISGAVCDNELLVSTLEDEIPFIALVAVVIIFTILFLLCDSWIEPFLFMACIGIAVIINMGTNALLPNVSFMTNAVGALLQLGLSMDYSIMLMNRYMQEKKENPDPATAMKNALANAFGAITSSSVTTIVGLLALVFMSFKIGQDMGIVLAKGVFISLICIFTVLPGLAVKADRLICKTHKKSLDFNMSGIMKFVTKARFIFCVVIILIVGGAFVLKGNLDISYIKMFENEQQKAIEDVFGAENQTVILYENDESTENILSYIKWLEAQEDVVSVQDYSNTLGKEYTYQELSGAMGFDLEQAKMMYRMYEDNKNASDYEKITMYDFICFAAEEVAGNEMCSGYMSEEQLTNLINSKKQLDEVKAQFDVGIQQSGMSDAEIEQGKAIFEKEMTDNELAEVLELYVKDIDMLLKLKRMMSVDVENTTLTLEQFMDFIIDHIMTNETFSAVMTDDMKNQILDGKNQILDNKEMMLGNKHNRMIITALYPVESAETFEFIGSIRHKAEEMIEGKVYFVGDSSMGYEMDKGFSKELNFVTILTIVAILIVVFLTFRSLISSSVLVVLIQSAVYITTALVCIQGINVNYIALILVQCILMGATIDYGILFLSNYREARISENRETAVITAMNRSIKTILTSSLILICSCLTVGIMMTQKIIAQTCSFIAYGAICSVIMVIFILPAVVLLLDRFVVKKRKDEKNA